MNRVLQIYALETRVVVCGLCFHLYMCLCDIWLWCCCNRPHRCAIRVYNDISSYMPKRLLNRSCHHTSWESLLPYCNLGWKSCMSQQQPNSKSAICRSVSYSVISYIDEWPGYELASVNLLSFCTFCGWASEPHVQLHGKAIDTKYLFILYQIIRLLQTSNRTRIFRKQ